MCTSEARSRTACVTMRFTSCATGDVSSVVPVTVTVAAYPRSASAPVNALTRSSRPESARYERSMSVRTSAPGARTTLTGRPAAVWSWRSCSGVGGPDIATARPWSARRIGSAPTERTIDSGSDSSASGSGAALRRSTIGMWSCSESTSNNWRSFRTPSSSRTSPSSFPVAVCSASAWPRTSTLMAPLPTSSSPSRGPLWPWESGSWTIASRGATASAADGSPRLPLFPCRRLTMATSTLWSNR